MGINFISEATPLDWEAARRSAQAILKHVDAVGFIAPEAIHDIAHRVRGIVTRLDEIATALRIERPASVIADGAPITKAWIALLMTAEGTVGGVRAYSWARFDKPPDDLATEACKAVGATRAVVYGIDIEAGPNAIQDAAQRVEHALRAAGIYSAVLPETLVHAVMGIK